MAVGELQSIFYYARLAGSLAQSLDSAAQALLRNWPTMGCSPAQQETKHKVVPVRVRLQESKQKRLVMVAVLARMSHYRVEAVLAKWRQYSVAERGLRRMEGKLAAHTSR